MGWMEDQAVRIESMKTGQPHDTFISHNRPSTSKKILACKVLNGSLKSRGKLQISNIRAGIWPILPSYLIPGIKATKLVSLSRISHMESESSLYKILPPIMQKVLMSYLDVILFSQQHYYYLVNRPWVAL